MYIQREEPVESFDYDGYDISFSTKNKKFALMAYRFVKKLAEKKFASETNEEIDALNDLIDELV
jgi:hypothetical protein